jgi:hypothetical protein
MVIFACIRVIATSAAEPILRVYAGEDPATHEAIAAPADPLLALLTGPNDEQSAYEFVEELVTHLYVAGNAYIHKVRAMRTSRVVRLFLLRPDRVSIRPGPGGIVESYGLRIDGKDQPPLPAEDVIHAEGHIIEVRRHLKLHDRFLIFNERCFLVGSSLKDAGQKTFSLIELVAGRPAIVREVERKWKEAGTYTLGTS